MVKVRDLDKLVNDKSSYIRADVARQGRKQNLEILANDSDEYVQKVAQAMREK